MPSLEERDVDDVPEALKIVEQPLDGMNDSPRNRAKLLVA